MFNFIKIVLRLNLLLLCFNLCCNINSQTVSIDIEANIRNMQQLRLSEFSSKIRYVPLETIDDQPIGVTIEATFFQGMILINGINSCLLFDDNGKFIRKIGSRGRGPGEYQYGGIIGINKNKSVYIKNMYDLFFDQFC